MNKTTMEKRVYYSQNREDLIIESFFPDVEHGFYVDIGANDPTIDSVTKLFYEKLWNGINVEPLTHHFDALKKSRPRDINLNIGISNKKGNLTLTHFVDGDGLSTFSQSIANGYLKDDTELLKNKVERIVKVETLKDIFDTNNVQKIHFMKIDVEGLEYDVLDGNNWKLYRPELICIESNHMAKDWRPLLNKNHYRFVFFDGLNEYYTDDKTNRHEKFNFVDHVVIEKGSGLRISDFNFIADQDEAIRNAHIYLQDTLQANALLTSEMQTILSENHINYSRAIEAERALKYPTAYIKYLLKKIHRRLIKVLSKKPIPEYSEHETKQLDSAKEKILKLKPGSNIFKKEVLNISVIETTRLKRLYRENKKQPILLDAYIKLVSGIKRIRMKGILK